MTSSEDHDELMKPPKARRRNPDFKLQRLQSYKSNTLDYWTVAKAKEAIKLKTPERIGAVWFLAYQHRAYRRDLEDKGIRKHDPLARDFHERAEKYYLGIYDRMASGIGVDEIEFLRWEEPTDVTRQGRYTKWGMTERQVRQLKRGKE